jgi:hypothetical protein
MMSDDCVEYFKDTLDRVDIWLSRLPPDRYRQMLALMLDQHQAWMSHMNTLWEANETEADRQVFHDIRLVSEEWIKRHG